MSRAAQQYMTEAKWGRIINLSSTSALGNRGQANYSAAKAGLQGFTKTLAIELGKFGVTVNAIAPGFIETDMTADTARRMGISFEDFKTMAAKQIPVGRVGQPEDIAAMVSFFAREESSFVSGQVIYVSGGLTFRFRFNRTTPRAFRRISIAAMHAGSGCKSCQCSSGSRRRGFTKVACETRRRLTSTL